MRTTVLQPLWGMSLLSAGTVSPTITEKENLAEIGDNGYFVLNQMPNITDIHEMGKISLIFLGSYSLLLCPKQ